MRKRRLRGRKLQKQRRIIVASVIGLTLLLSTGYAAFSTNISLSAKGNIKEKEKTAAETLVENEEIQESTSTISGLYKDTTEEPVDGKYRYVYKGEDPDNYFTFNDEEAGWRIVSIESDGTIKIVKTEILGNMSWDAKNTRASGIYSYCANASSYGCNAWAKASSLASSNSTLQSQLTSRTFTLYGTKGGTSGTEYSGEVTKDASLNTFLNNDYYTNSTNYTSYLNSTSRQYIEKHDFNVSTPGDNSDTESIATDVEQEKLYTWNGYVGLITATDYLRTTTNTACTSLSYAYNNTGCGSNNWLNNSTNYYWTISPSVSSNRYNVWSVFGGILVNYGSATSSFGVRPTLFLKKDINIKGEGTSEKPYYIDES